MAKSFQRFTLHVQLQHIEPPIWRRIEVEGTESLRKLHHILQAAFGWEDTHLHDFLVGGMTYAMFEVDDVLDFAGPGTTADDRKVRLQKVLKPGSRFLYRYDFGDGWDHVIVVEKVEIVEREPWGAAQIIDGTRACPPEDVGGPLGYDAFLNTLSNDPNSEEAEYCRTGLAAASMLNGSICVLPMPRCHVWHPIGGETGNSRRQDGTGSALTYLSFAEREEIAWLSVQGLGVGEIVRLLGRSPSTVSRELTRNAATRGGYLEYRASVAQWKAERFAKRPKPLKLATNARLRQYVQERLEGEVYDADSREIAGPRQAPFKGRINRIAVTERGATAGHPSKLPIDCR